MNFLAEKGAGVAPSQLPPKLPPPGLPPPPRGDGAVSLPPQAALLLLLWLNPTPGEEYHAGEGKVRVLSLVLGVERSNTGWSARKLPIVLSTDREIRELHGPV